MYIVVYLFYLRWFSFGICNRWIYLVWTLALESKWYNIWLKCYQWSEDGQKFPSLQTKSRILTKIISIVAIKKKFPTDAIFLQYHPNKIRVRPKIMKPKMPISGQCLKVLVLPNIISLKLVTKIGFYSRSVSV